MLRRTGRHIIWAMRVALMAGVIGTTGIVGFSGH
jgi:hypothetical protein